MFNLHVFVRSAFVHSYVFLRFLLRLAYFNSETRMETLTGGQFCSKLFMLSLSLKREIGQVN